jgi:hypothetical protein
MRKTAGGCRKLACKKPQNHARYHLGKPMAFFQEIWTGHRQISTILRAMEEPDG